MQDGRKKPLRWGGGCNEELGPVGVLSCVGHAEKAFLGVLQLEVLVRELGAVDCHILAWEQPYPARRHTGLSASAIALGEVASLDHEVLNDTVEG